MPKQEIFNRADSLCELCKSDQALDLYCVPPHTNHSLDSSVLLCATCLTQIKDTSAIDNNHWRCLNDSMWSAVPAVQALAWRMLNHLNNERWAEDALDILFLDDQTLEWAKSGRSDNAEVMDAQHLDAYGSILSAGDTVTLSKDLNVKGTSFTAKRGTAVRGISLVQGNAKQIEGRINGQQIVILTAFVKKV